MRVFNLLAALLVALDKENNMCNKRFEALYKKVSEMEVEVSVCNSDDKLYPKEIKNLEGLQELLSLYQQYNVDGMDNYNAVIAEEMNLLKEKMGKVFKSSLGKSQTDSSKQNSSQLEEVDKLLEGNLKRNHRRNTKKKKKNSQTQTVPDKVET